VLKRLRQEAGFGLLELLMAMVVLNIGILATVGAFNAGIVAMHRSGMIATASVLGDKQMELYRTLTYGDIALDPSTIPGVSPYTTDPAWASTQDTTTCSAPIPAQCNASQSVTGPDHHTYRVDTYIVDAHPNGSSRVVKQVTVVVRDGQHLSHVLDRSTSTFDCSTALPYAAGCPST
jgi:Tfp pilus assembly protein PilE